MWLEACKDLVWKTENFFDVDAFDSIYSYVNNYTNSVVFKSDRDKPIVSYSNFHYGLILSEIRKDPVITARLKDNLNHLFEQLHAPKVLNLSTKTSQLMLKFFNGDSRYELHVENPSLFGGFAYVVYLSDEISGTIHFPTQEEISLIDNSSQEYLNWMNMKTGLVTEGHDILYSERSFSFTPKKNSAIVFRTGVPHKVDRIVNKKIGRYILTGWPFALLS